MLNLIGSETFHKIAILHFMQKGCHIKSFNRAKTGNIKIVNGRVFVQVENGKISK